jgi:hypothetical protein
MVQALARLLSPQSSFVHGVVFAGDRGETAGILPPPR